MVGDGAPDPDAAVDAADKILTGATPSGNVGKAYSLYGNAAAAGSALAAHRLAVLKALGVARPPSWHEALDHLREARLLGHRTAAQQLDLLDGETLFPSAAASAVMKDPMVVVVDSLVSRSVCNWIIESGRGRLAPGQVNHISDGAPTSDPMRTAEAAPFQLAEMDVVLTLTLERISRAIGLPLHQFEPANLLHYAPGQEYRPHFDFINPAVTGFQQQLAVFGQRVATVLVYLNDAYDGGETSFPTLGFKFRGKPGDALVFFNIDRDGRPHRGSLHAGLPPTRGEKWVLSVWIRDKVQPIV